MNDQKANGYCPTEDDPRATGTTLAEVPDQDIGETDEEAWDRIGDIIVVPCVLSRDCSGISEVQ